MRLASRFGRFIPEKATLIPIKQEKGSATEQVLVFWRRETILVPARVWTPDSPTLGLVTVCTMWWLA